MKLTVYDSKNEIEIPDYLNSLSYNKVTVNAAEHFGANKTPPSA